MHFALLVVARMRDVYLSLIMPVSKVGDPLLLLGQCTVNANELRLSEIREGAEALVVGDGLLELRYVRIVTKLEVEAHKAFDHLSLGVLMADHFLQVVYLGCAVRAVDSAKCLLGPERRHIVEEAAVYVHCYISQVGGGVDFTIGSGLVNGVDGGRLKPRLL